MAARSVACDYTQVVLDYIPYINNTLATSDYIPYININQALSDYVPYINNTQATSDYRIIYSYYKTSTKVQCITQAHCSMSVKLNNQLCMYRQIIIVYLIEIIYNHVPG